MTRERALAALLLAVVAGFAACGGDAPAPVSEELTDPTAEDAVPDEEPADDQEATAEAADDLLRTAAVEIYFPSVAGDGLVGEFREIFDTATPGDRVKQIVNDLISGPTGSAAVRAVPAGTRLRQVYVLDDGTAYLDFSPELTEGIGGGSMKELLTVYSIVDSIAYNVREVSRVAILVNGRAIETMNGHMDLRRPLKPEPRWILGSDVVRATVRAHAG